MVTKTAAGRAADWLRIRFERVLERFALAMCRVFSVTPDQIERHRARHRRPPGPRRPPGAFEA